MDTQGIVPLVLALADAKRAENDAKAARIAAEEALIEALKFERPEGSETYTLNEGRTMAKVTLTRPITRSVDSEAWPTVLSKLSVEDSEKVEGLMRTKYELAVGKARNIEENMPALWRKLAVCISSKPGKVSVEIKEVVTL